MTEFQQQILQGIPEQLPPKKSCPKNGNPAPKRKDVLSKEEKNWPYKMRYVIFRRLGIKR